MIFDFGGDFVFLYVNIYCYVWCDVYDVWFFVLVWCIFGNDCGVYCFCVWCVVGGLSEM